MKLIIANFFIIIDKYQMCLRGTVIVISCHPHTNLCLSICSQGGEDSKAM